LQWTGGDLNPRPPECKSRTYGSEVPSLPSIDWEGFKGYLLKTHVERNAYDLLRTARKYGGILWVPTEASGLQSLSDSNRRLVMASLANLSKFLGLYKAWKDIIENTGLKWSSGQSEDIIIKRFTKTQNSEDIINWVRSLKGDIPKISSFLDFMAITGIRFVEAINSYNLIIDLNRGGHLNEYYNRDRELLEHFKFKDLFLRRSKKVFISFISEDPLSEVVESPRLTKTAIENRVKRSSYPMRFGDIREYWASIMTKHLSQPEIDFLQGRISTSVFMRNYFNPAWITDLKDRCLKASSSILEKIKV